MKTYIKKIINRVFRIFKIIFLSNSFIEKLNFSWLLKSGQIKFSDFPNEVWIENTNHCNANCVMCPHDKQTRDQGFMSLNLFEKIINEVAKFKKQVERVHLHNFGEPLLDHDLVKKITIAKKVGIKHVFFVSNGSLMTKDLGKQIIMAGLDEIKFSFYGTDKDTYEKTMRNLKYEKSLENIKQFIKTREELDVKTPKIIIQYLPQRTNMFRNDDFKKIFTPMLRKDIGDKLSIFKLHNFGGGNDNDNLKSLRNITSICNYPWKTMVILFDGKVVLCCLDYNGVQIVGDVNKLTLSEIWNGDIFSATRNKFMNLKYEQYPVCLRCDVIK